MKCLSRSLLIVALASLRLTSQAQPAAGHVSADDFPTLQAAVDALGTIGGEVRLGARTYQLHQPVRLKHRIRFQGVMDSKVRESVSCITAASDFKGDWLFETVPSMARKNADLNKDICFFDVDLTGGKTVGGIKVDNVDGMRLERCRLASLRYGVLVTQVTDQPRPWHWDISPGGVFINNCIFRCLDTAIRLEYATQIRIYANWFVSGGAVALHIKNSDKTWFLANEINSFTRSAIVIEDDGKPGNCVTDIFLSHNWINAPDPTNKYLELLPHGKPLTRIQFIDNILIGKGTADTAALASDRGNRFADNVATQPGYASRATGEALVGSETNKLVIAHRLYRRPDHVSITFKTEPPRFWVSEMNETTFTVHFAQPLKRGAFTWSACAGL